ncbi:MAG TPA: hypothetical protein VGL99_13390 [Chloroflexota bacterium]
MQAATVVISRVAERPSVLSALGAISSRFIDVVSSALSMRARVDHLTPRQQRDEALRWNEDFTRES